MKARIDTYGLLSIMRAGKWKEQGCPFQPPSANGPSTVQCGDWCARFGEVTHETSHGDWLTICYGIGFEVIDERVRPQDEQSTDPEGEGRR